MAFDLTHATSKLRVAQKLRDRLPTLLSDHDIYHSDSYRSGKKQVSLANSDQQNLFDLLHLIDEYDGPDAEKRTMQKAICLASHPNIRLPFGLSPAQKKALYRSRDSADFDPGYMPRTPHQCQLLKANVNPASYVAFWDYVVKSAPDDNVDFARYINQAFKTCRMQWLRAKGRPFKKRYAEGERPWVNPNPSRESVERKAAGAKGNKAVKAPRGKAAPVAAGGPTRKATFLVNGKTIMAEVKGQPFYGGKAPAPMLSPDADGTYLFKIVRKAKVAVPPTIAST